MSWRRFAESPETRRSAKRFERLPWKRRGRETASTETPERKNDVKFARVSFKLKTERGRTRYLRAAELFSASLFFFGFAESAERERNKAPSPAIAATIPAIPCASK